MKGKIDKNGMLLIERRGQMTHQVCPFAEGESFCGDWCPLFGVPKPSHWIGSINPEGGKRKLDIRDWDLLLCKGIVYFDELIQVGGEKI